MIDNFKKPLIPVVLIIVLFSLYFTRWDTETKTPSGPTQLVYKTDRWTGQRWIITYRGNDVSEKPVLDNYAVTVYSESVKQRPDVIEQRQKMTEKAQSFPGTTAQQKGFSSLLSMATYPKEKLISRALKIVDKEINDLAIMTAEMDLGNKAWAKRKYLAWTWDGLMALSLLWLMTTLLIKKKNTGAV